MEENAAAIGNFKRPESVLVVVYTRLGEVLMMERARPKGFWQSITGSLRWGEGTLHAARRELHEETGLLPSHVRDLGLSASFPIIPPWKSRYAPEHHTNTERWFAMELTGRRIIRLNAQEHSQYRWLPWQEAAARASSYTNRDCIRRLFPA